MIHIILCDLDFRIMIAIIFLWKITHFYAPKEIWESICWDGYNNHFHWM